MGATKRGERVRNQYGTNSIHTQHTLCGLFCKKTHRHGAREAAENGMVKR
jgi:hypothetical protein